MFAHLDALPADALLGLTKLFKDDKRTDKIDLGVGVYRTVEGVTPVMRAVSEAQRMIVESEDTKSYLPPDGAPGFSDSLKALLFGEIDCARIQAVQTPGGCGALAVGANLATRGGADLFAIGSPTWANHAPLLGAAGVTISMIPYYNADSGAVDFEAFYSAAKELGPSHVLLLHAACHNPTGADLTTAECDAIAELSAKNGFLPFIDCAYHGFAKGLQDDSYLVRRVASTCPQMLVAYSCSKNFGLYRERTGALFTVAETEEKAHALKSHAINIARQFYSMPPAHGGLIVSKILTTPTLSRLWENEVELMRQTIAGNRCLLVETADKYQLDPAFGKILHQNGMFSLLPVTIEQVMALRNRHGIYLANNGRANLCGVNSQNVDYLCQAVVEVCKH